MNFFKLMGFILMNIRNVYFLLILFLLSLSSPVVYAEDKKCVALANFASTLYINKKDIKERQMLEEWESKSNPIDFAFIRLFFDIAFNLNTIPAKEFEFNTNNFCQKISYSLLNPNVQSKFDSKSCSSFVNLSQVINVFRESGDTPQSLRRHFIRTQGYSSVTDKITVDYLSLMSELRFSSVFNKRNDMDFINFSKHSCNYFIDYINSIDRGLVK